MERLLELLRREKGVDRRLFIAYVASLSTVPWLGLCTWAKAGAVSFPSDPFRLGVASGDPLPSSVVLWSRLAPQPLEPGGGMPREAVHVAWEVAIDESMRNVVRSGTSVAPSELAHSVHVEVDGLEPNRWYWYRFRAGDAESPIGRTRTLPTADAMPRELRFAFASCQHFETGYYTAYENMARDELDLVFHLGDYIYEYAGEENRVRKHVGREIATLEDYRIRHAQYKTDPHLQAMHARCPWMVTWDDHEFDNNCANDISEQEHIPPVDFLVRRANAYQAYYEHMPLRRVSVPRGCNMQLYRKLSFGRLAEFLVLDTRQYRTNQPNFDGRCGINAAAMSPDATILGPDQRHWLEASLTNSPATWNVLAQQVMMAMVDTVAGDARHYWMDQWPGYMHDRQRLVSFLADKRVSNPVVLTGDYHANWVNDIRLDDRRNEMPVIATEFVGTSISSEGNGQEHPDDLDTTLADNPCVRFYNRERGYVRCTVTENEWQSDYRVVDSVTAPTSQASIRASFLVAAGHPGADRL